VGDKSSHGARNPLSFLERLNEWFMDVLNRREGYIAAALSKTLIIIKTKCYGQYPNVCKKLIWRKFL
jgi:hypothetical protein